MKIAPVVGVEIGTTKIAVVVGEMREGGHILITGLGKHPSAGVRKGVISDLENATICVRSALSAAAKSSKVAIHQVHLAVSGGHIQSHPGRGSAPILSKNRVVTQDDIDEVMKVARAVDLPPDCEVIHTLWQTFSIDDQEHIVSPRGMVGRLLTVDALILYGLRTSLENTIQALTGVPVEVEDVAFSGLCSALSVLAPEQHRTGALVIDLGGGKTDYVASVGTTVAAAGALGVGGDHVTNDIALAFGISLTQAESVKQEWGSAVVDPKTAGQRVSTQPEVGFPARSIPMRSLHTVIHVRTDEIFRIVKARLESDGVLSRIGMGVVLTGGGARLRGVVDLASRVFGLPCSIGKPRNVTGLAAATEGPEYATCTGLVQFGFQTREQANGESSIWQWLKGQLR